MTAVTTRVERHAPEEEQLDRDEAEQGPAAEAFEHVVHLAREGDGGAGADEGEADARDDGRGREEGEPAVPVEALKERVDVGTRDPDALEAGQRHLDRLHDEMASIARQRLAQPRPRLERQELPPLELAEEARDDVEVELPVFQDVRRRDLLQRRGAVHLLPEELLVRGQQEESLRRRVLEDEPGRGGDRRAELGDLERLRVHAAGPRVEVAHHARDVTELEVLVAVATDEQLELRRGRPLHHRASTSRPVASRPQRVASATCWVDRRSRSMKTWTIA